MSGHKVRTALYSLALASVLTLVGATTAQAATITFNFTNGSGNEGSDGAGVNDGNVRTFSSGGVTITATAWSYYNNLFNDGKLGIWAQGLGVCNDSEQPGCSSPNHQVDNEGSSGAKDYVLFQFSSPILFNSALSDYVKVTTTDGSDLDASWWASAAALPSTLLSNKSLADFAALGFGARTDSGYSGSSSTRNVLLGTGYITSLLFGADYGGNNDSFKIGGMQVDPAAPPVPEPTSMLLLGSGLIFGAGRLRRRKKSDGQ